MPFIFFQVAGIFQTVDSDREAPEESRAASEENRDEVSSLLLRRLRDMLPNIDDTMYDVTSNTVLENATRLC